MTSSTNAEPPTYEISSNSSDDGDTYEKPEIDFSQIIATTDTLIKAMRKRWWNFFQRTTEEAAIGNNLTIRDLKAEAIGNDIFPLFTNWRVPLGGDAT